MVERLVILAALAGVVTLAVLVIRRWNARRVAQLVGAASIDPVWQSLGARPDGRRTVVAFSSPSCAACRTVQAPALAHVEERLGNQAVRFIRIDAARQPEVARAFGVLTVPSTVVMAGTGQVVAVNQGFAPSNRLVEQLQRT